MASTLTTKDDQRDVMPTTPAVDEVVEAKEILLQRTSTPPVRPTGPGPGPARPSLRVDSKDSSTIQTPSGDLIRTSSEASTPTIRASKGSSPANLTTPAISKSPLASRQDLTSKPNPITRPATVQDHASPHSLAYQASFIHARNVSSPPTISASRISTDLRPKSPVEPRSQNSSRRNSVQSAEPASPTNALGPSLQQPSIKASSSSRSSAIAKSNATALSSTPSLTQTLAPRPPPLASTNSSANASKRAEPVLPHARVAKAPANSMYWSRTPVSGRIPRPMRAHTAVAVSPSSIYCFGGCDLKGTCFRDVWKLDCDTFLWTKPKVSGEIPPVTRAHTATVVGDRIWIIGGGDGPTYFNNVYYFDTVSHEWVKPPTHGTAPSKRRAHAAVLFGTKIVLFGGGNGANALNDVHALDISNRYRPTWSELSIQGNRPVRRGYHSITLVGTRCIVFGGSDGSECFSDLWMLDLEALTWTEIIPEPPAVPAKSTAAQPIRTEAFPRLSHSATLLGSYLVVFGGHDGIDFSNELLFFNLVSLQWEPRKTFGVPPSPRGYHTCVLHDSRLLCIGGFDGKQVFDECFTLDLGALAFLPQVTQFKVVVYDEEENTEVGKS